MKIISWPKDQIRLATGSVLNDVALRSEKDCVFGVCSLKVDIFEVALWSQSYRHSIFWGEVSAIVDFDTPFFDLAWMGVQMWSDQCILRF
jgi:hypothetical protein